MGLDCSAWYIEHAANIHDGSGSASRTHSADTVVVLQKPLGTLHEHASLSRAWQGMCDATALSTLVEVVQHEQ